MRPRAAKKGGLEFLLERLLRVKMDLRAMAGQV